MALKRTCDRCNVSINEKDISEELVRIRVIPYINFNAVDSSECILSADLCKKCIDDLKIFL